MEGCEHQQKESECSPQVKASEPNSSCACVSFGSQRGFSFHVLIRRQHLEIESDHVAAGLSASLKLWDQAVLGPPARHHRPSDLICPAAPWAV